MSNRNRDGRRGRCRTRATLLSAVVCALLYASPSRAIILADPATFTVKGTWSAGTLGVPTNFGGLGGIRFSSDGNTLYVVGNTDVPASAVYAVPVVRDPGTNEIVDLMMASATPVFSANVSAGGIDSGPASGPAGTLFYSYYNANNGHSIIAERRVGDLATEMQFDVGPLGVTELVTGLAFAPYRLDPGTGFGRLHVGVYSGDADTTPRDVYEVLLTPLGNGFFAPGSATHFLTLVDGIPNGLCYVPVEPFVGDLMYASYDAGEVRYVAIDPATGLAIDSKTGVPTLATISPVDTLFASDLGIGPVGLDFDPITTDLFISTYQGAPANSIIQIGGFSVATTTTTTTTLIAPSTSTTSSTTLPSLCLPDATFEAIGCRLDEILAQVQSLSGADAVAGKLEHKIANAKARLQSAQSRLDAGHARGARGAVGKAIRLIRGFRIMLGSRKAQAIPATVRGMFSTEANGIQNSLLALKQSI